MAGFQNTICEYVDLNILNPIINFLAKEKNTQVTIEELRTVLQLPVTTPSPMRVSGVPQAGVVPVQAPSLNNFMAMTGKASARKKDKMPHNGPTCTYKFKRGDKKGQVCGEPCVEGSEFCKHCIKNKTATGNTATAKETTPMVPTMDTKAVSKPNNDSTSGELSVVPYKNQSGFFKTVQHGFIVKQMDGNQIVATGVEENGKVRPLNDNEKKIAYDIGIAILENEAPPQDPIPKINPLIGSNITIPTIPKIQ